MSYLLSLLTADSPAKESEQILCYYINTARDIQIIRVMSGLKCHFERLIFVKERFLFMASPESYLEVHSSSSDRRYFSNIACKSLQVHEQTETAMHTTSTPPQRGEHEMELSVSTASH